VKLPLALAVEVTGGRLGGGRAPGLLHVLTDTRRLAPGDTFLALHGERFDGHDFAGDAVHRGAALLVLDREAALDGDTPVLHVADTKAAYMALDGAARGLFRGRVAAITGSTGKTTTKDFLAQLLAAAYGERVLASPNNENNEIGVSKLLLSASNETHDVLVVEMGARHYGDIDALVAIAAPETGILTNVGDAHLEIVGSRERLAETKWALFSRGARAVLNADDAVSHRRAPSLERPPHWFFFEGAHPKKRIHDVSPPYTGLIGDERLVHSENGQTEEYAVDLRVPGAHNRENLAAAVAGALELSVPMERIAATIPIVRLPAGRYDPIPLPGGVRLIYDAYNANAQSMLAALATFATEPASRRIAVLASMAELGEESALLHERVGEHAARSVDVLLVSGEYAADVTRGARRGGMTDRQIVEIATNADAARWIREHAGPDDVVLLKGSRKYKLEEIVTELRA